MKIYGHPGTSAGRCYWVLEELGIDYERGELNMRNGDHKKPWFKAISPAGKIPALSDGSLNLCESMAINQYLTEKFAPSFAGVTLEDRAMNSQWNYWAIAEYQKPMIELFIEKVFVPEAKRSVQVIDKCLGKLKGLNDYLNQSLSGRNYLVNHEFSLADLNVASVAKINSAVGIDISEFSNLDQWLNRILERKSALKVAEMATK